jgi:hypothetical protein
MLSLERVRIEFMTRLGIRDTYLVSAMGENAS